MTLNLFLVVLVIIGALFMYPIIMSYVRSLTTDTAYRMPTDSKVGYRKRRKIKRGE